MIWKPEIKKGSGPIYVAICDALERGIAEGQLPPGRKLPPHRDLAYQLGVTVGTVARAYSEAATRGLVVGEVGRGTFINDFDNHRDDITRLVVPDKPRTDVIDLGLNLSAVGEAEDLLRSTLKDLSRSGSLEHLLTYQPSAGMYAHRAIAAQSLEPIGIRAHPDNIIICNGGQHGLLISMMAVAGHGETVATEALTYPGARAIAHQLGINLAAVHVDEEGPDPAALRELCETRKPKALYCMPVLQNPTTATMSEARMREIAAIAESHDLWIIEDDVYGFLADSRPPPFASLIPERTIYLTSASKSLAPGLRIGFLAAPPRLSRAIQEIVTMSNWMSPPIMAAVVTNWIANGHAERLVDWHRNQARERQDLAHQILGPYAERASTYCYHLWLRLPEPWRMDSFSAAALREGVRVITADAFAVKRDHAPHAVRLCLGAANSLPQIALGLNRVRDLLRSQPRPQMDLQTIGYG
ncbi:MAG: PLP-dependent aminotransferase family protein [Parvibaculaceae bacterium]